MEKGNSAHNISIIVFSVSSSFRWVFVSFLHVHNQKQEDEFAAGGTVTIGYISGWLDKTGSLCMIHMD